MCSITAFQLVAKFVSTEELVWFALVYLGDSNQKVIAYLSKLSKGERSSQGNAYP